MEYCIMEQLNISCKGESVIMMQTAVYGIMNVGRCLKDSYVNIDNIDCSNNVIADLDAACSGQKSCTMRIPSQNLHDIYQNNPHCPSGLAAHLEVTYRCIDGKFPPFIYNFQKLSFYDLIRVCDIEEQLGRR